MAEEEVKVVGLTTPKSKGKTNWKIVGALFGIVVLVLGVLAGILLVKQQQDIREKADSCKEACPGSDGQLHNCHPPENDGSSKDSVCNQAGRIEFCGTRNYCCPAAGGNWTTNMSLCASAATLTATATAMSTATSGASASPTAAPQCNTSCTSNAQCASGSVCNITSGTSGFCRNSQCVNDSDCVCATSTATASSTATATATSTPTSVATSSSSATKTASPTSTSTSNATATTFPVPETGASLPTILGAGVGAIIILASIVLAL